MKEILKISQEEYFARPEISNSMLKDFRTKGPWTYYHTHVKRTVEQDPPSEAMIIGSAFHCLMSGEEDGIATYADTYPPDGSSLNLRKKEHRDYMAAQREEASNKGLIYISEEDLDHVEAMVQSVLDNPGAREILAEKGAHEQPCTNVVQEMPVRALADLDLSSQGIVVDFKTTRRHTMKDFAKDAFYRFGYHFQAAHYLDVFEAESFIIIGVRNFKPYESIVYECPPEMIRDARHINYDTLHRIRWCESTDYWHGDGWGEVCNLEEVLNNG